MTSRGRLGRLGLALGAVALAALAVVRGWLPTPLLNPEAGVPDHIWSIDAPAGTTWPGGRAAVAFQIDGSADIVLVGAEDRAYRRVALRGPRFTGSALALSPDGRWLAFDRDTATDGSAGDTAHLRLLDLEHGTTVDPPLGGSGAVREVRGLGWSPDSRWLVWIATTTTPTADDTIAASEAIGRVRVATGLGESATLPAGSVATAGIADDGTVWVTKEAGSGPDAPDATDLSREVLPTWMRRPAYPFVSGIDTGPIGLVSPGGGLLLTGRDRASSGRSMRVVGTLTERGVDLVFPPLPRQSEADARPVGWLDERHAVVDLTRHRTRGVIRAPRRELAIVDVTQPSQTPRRVSTVESPSAHGAIATLSVATGLMSLEDPTVPTPRRPWAWTMRTAVLAGAVGLVVMALVLGVTVGWLRERRRTRATA